MIQQSELRFTRYQSKDTSYGLNTMWGVLFTGTDSTEHSFMTDANYNYVKSYVEKRGYTVPDKKEFTLRYY